MDTIIKGRKRLLNMNSVTHGQKPGRDDGIDVARGLAMLLVICGHALEIYVHQDHAAGIALFGSWRIIYGFHVPLFFLISGMVFKQKSLQEHLAAAMKLLFIAWSVHVFFWICGGLLMEPAPTLMSFLKPFIFLNGFQGVVIWFLAALGVVELAFHLLLARQGVARWALLLMIFAVFLTVQFFDKTVWQLACLFPALIFYAIGYLVAQNHGRFRGFSSRGMVSIAALGLAALLAPLNHGCAWSLTDICQIDGSDFVVLVTYGRYGNPLLFSITALAGSFGIVWMAEFIACKGGRFSDALCWVGRRTLDLLIVNAFFFVLALPFLRQHAGASADTPALAAVVVLAVVAVQLALLPLVIPATRCITRAASRLATRLSCHLVPARMP